jgi:hypothetical protein
MKRWTLLLLFFATPLSSPLGCGGDGCLRNSDCASNRTCSAGECVLKDPPAANGGEGGEDSTPSSSAGTTTAGSGGRSGSGGSATAGSSSTAGGESSAGQASAGEAGAAGESALLIGGAGAGGAPDTSFGGL